jgi:hypothetical protein
MRLPLAGAALAGLAAAAAARLAPNDVMALLISGLAALAIVGALGYHVRGDLARLRERKSAEPRSTTLATPVDRHDPGDSTGPIPLALDPPLVPDRSLDALPLYLATVKSLRWDPAATGRGSASQHERHDHRDLPVIFTKNSP